MNHLFTSFTRRLREWAEDIRMRLTGSTADFVHRSRKRKQRRYWFFPNQTPLQRHLRQLTVAGLVCVMAFSLFRIGSYTMEYLSSRRTSEELRAAYNEAAMEEAAAITPAPLPAYTPLSTATAVPETTHAPSSETVQTPVQLADAAYPENPYAIVSSRFSKIQRQNSDIIGWLTIPDLIDEAVVQRDNSYYLHRDYRGYHNDNGAIFLDENCSLNSRPYTLMLYGHNMKSGAMFGCLRNYERVYFYRNNPFITFDTAYEDGRYVIFAVGTFTQNSQRLDYLDIRKLTSTDVAAREIAIAQLKRMSSITVDIDVHAEDQLLLLITCVDDDASRRCVAARRLREGEKEEDFDRAIRHAYSR